jgi:hypothetical protein
MYYSDHAAAHHIFIIATSLSMVIPILKAED